MTAKGGWVTPLIFLAALRADRGYEVLVGWGQRGLWVVRGSVRISRMTNGARADYGIDAPHVIRNLFLVGLGVAVLCRLVHQFTVGRVTFVLYPNLFWTAGSFALGGVLMLLYSKVGKFRHRDRMLRQVEWTGGERVLDAGTGRGLLLIGAAKQLTGGGKATGLDIWNQEDLSGDNLQNLERNIAAEGVGAKTDVVNEDVQKMTFRTRRLT